MDRPATFHAGLWAGEDEIFTPPYHCWVFGVIQTRLEKTQPSL